MKRLVLFAALAGVILLISCSGNTSSSGTLSLEKGWRFREGDDLNWAKPDIDDSQWDTISISNYWENLGHKDYNGVAWYRFKVFIPSSLRDNAYLKDSIQIRMGKIDDSDQLYLNGSFFGQNNKIYNTPPADSIFYKESDYVYVERRYILSASNPSILWDKENVIAVRVNDLRYGGGMYSGKPSISMIDIADKLIIDKSTYPYRFKSHKVSKRFALKNTSEVELKGTFIIEMASGNNQGTFFRNENKVTIPPGETLILPEITLDEKDEATGVKLIFKHRDSKQVITSADEVPYILTPKPGDAPAINGAKVLGVRPGAPFLFAIPATGVRPMTYGAEDLPDGLSLDTRTGIIKGMISIRGNYKVTLVVKNAKGENRRELKIVAGDKLALTPPLGWNSYNCWCGVTDDTIVINTAHAFVEKGLINHGWTYINIDDGWQAGRDIRGEIMPNSRFRDMKALVDTIHRLGLKFGIYSSPGPKTCGGFTGSYQHEFQDAKTFASWGVDFLKYDWCTYSQIAKDESLPELKKPYIIMHDALTAVKRDIIYSLCQYGMGNVWEWGSSIGGNLWRTAFDITDTWESVCKIGFSDQKNADFAGPGHWNDLDMMVIGWVGWGPDLYPSRLTADEQYTHFSLWSLISAPLLLGCDLNRLDDFTLNLITNDEVLAVNQDTLGNQAIPVMNKNGIQVWIKELEDGSTAAGIFNLNDNEQEISVDLNEIGIKGMQQARDLWRQKDIGQFESSFSAKVAAHGVKLIKFSMKD